MSGVISEGEGHEFENAVPQKALEEEEKMKPPTPSKPPLKPPLKPSLSTPEVPPPCEKAVNDSQEKKEKGQEKDKEKEKGKEAKKKKEKKRKIVFVAYKINCISNIDSILCTYEVDAKIFYFWDDEKVVGRPKGTSLKLEDEPELFNPDIVVTNGHNLDIQSVDVKVTDAKKGSVKMSIHIKGECFLTAMELHLFPFDCQNLLITLKPYKLPYEEVILISKPEEECAMDNNVTQEWDVFGHCTISTTTDPATSSTNKAYSSLSVAVLVTRRPGWFINNVFFVSLLLLFVSWSTFAMPIEERGEKMAISTSTLLAIIGNKYVVGNELPKLQYRTLCDQYVDFCFTLQIITIGSFLLVYYWSSHEMDGVGNLGALFNDVAFSFQLYATVAFHYWLAWRLKVHSADMNMWIEILKPEESRVQNNQRESRPEIPGCSFTSISYNHRLDLAKLQFIEAARKMTRIAAFREAQVYGRIQQRDTIAARMFQKHWMAYVARRKGGIVRFDYAKFKEKLLFLEGCRKMTRIASFRESLIYNRIAMAKMIAALMFQKAWKAHRVRVRENIIPLRRFLFRDSRRMAPSRENSRLSDVSA